MQPGAKSSWLANWPRHSIAYFGTRRRKRKVGNGNWTVFIPSVVIATRWCLNGRARQGVFSNPICRFASTMGCAILMELCSGHCSQMRFH